MTKIFEALEQARQEQGGTETNLGLQTGEVSGSGRAHRTYNPRVERAMIGLYQKICSAPVDSEGGRTIEFIGAQWGEGSSTLIREFAMVAATKLGKSVLLLDANQRSPEQFAAFGVESDRGWDEAVGNSALFQKAVVRIGDSRLFVAQLSLGMMQPVFSLPKVGDFFTAMRQQFDLVLLDAPGAAISSEGAALSSQVDGVIIVAESEKTRWQVADNARILIEQQGGRGRVLGVVMNKRRHIIPGFIYKRI